MIRDEALLNYRTSDLKLSCQSCRDYSHELSTCPFVNLVCYKPKLLNGEGQIEKRSSHNRK